MQVRSWMTRSGFAFQAGSLCHARCRVTRHADASSRSVREAFLRDWCSLVVMKSDLDTMRYLREEVKARPLGVKIGCVFRARYPIEN